MLEMTSRQFLIIRLLQKSNGSMKGQTLSKILDISTRTLRNDISSINANTEDFHISSSNNGYSLTLLTDNAHILLNDIKISEQTKSMNIVLKYLFEHPQSHLLDLSIDCYMSESSVVRCINNMKPLLDKYQLKISRQKDIFTLEGSEYNKRNLLAHLIHQEASHSLNDLQSFQIYFESFDADEVKEIVDKILNKYEITVDDIHYQNLLVNICISLQRTLSGEDIEPLPFRYTIDAHHPIYQLSAQLEKSLEEHFHIQFSKTDVEYIEVLCIGSIKMDDEDVEDRILYNDYSFVYKIKEILDDTMNHFALDIDYQMSLNQFALHIHRLLFRSQSSFYFQNDFNKNLQYSHPFIYELAVYFTYKLKETFDITVQDNEIGLLAIYLGLMIQSDVQPTTFLKALCICPDYNDLRKHFYHQFMLHFSDSVQLIGFVSSLKETKNYQYDFLISTINDYENTDCIVVSPLLLPQDVDKLTLKIQLLKDRREKEQLKKELAKYINEKLFFRNVNFDKKKDAILFLCSQMLKYGNADTDFVYSVFEREKITTTSFFNKFAIPHAIEFGSVKTCITFLINDKPIPWGEDKYVYLVMLVSINKKDIESFQTIYSAIIYLLMDNDAFAKMLNIETFDQLSEFLLSNISTKK
ncbi:MAG: PTS sugar transporter subunit IIA [Erysipelotrichaceae bacterium]|nr:PTS sugar transporter subunit IIA [Erysipelotrichaceae bacterium]